jgi:uncharacterized protein
MRTCSVTIEGRCVCVAERVGMAESFWPRFRGLMLRRSVPLDEGVFFDACSSIHMFFMLTAIDVVYLDADDKVVRVVAGLRPWRLSWCRGAAAVLELAPGRAAEAGVETGDRLVFVEQKVTA